MMSDNQPRNSAEAELAWDPSITAGHTASPHATG